MRNRREPQDLDATDRKLIALLRANARRSITALGKELGLSRTAVQERIRRLELDKIILGYTALANVKTATSVSAILLITIATRPCAPVLQKLAEIPEHVALYSTSGEIDAFLIVEAKNTARLSQLVDEIAAISGISDVTSSVVLTQTSHRI